MCVSTSVDQPLKTGSAIVGFFCDLTLTTCLAEEAQVPIL
jgi:hypothetical protein